MYNDMVKAEAFTYYSRGISFRKIAEILKNHPDCETLTHSTIKKWSETPDFKGRLWEDRKRDLDLQIEEGQDSMIIKTKVDVIKETEEIMSDVIEDIKTGTLEFKTKDAAIYAFNAIAKYNKQLKDENKRINIEDQVTLLMDAMNEVPEVAEVLSKHWGDVDKIFQKKALGLAKDKRLGRE